MSETKTLWHPQSVIVTIAAMLGVRLDRSGWQALAMFVGVLVSAAASFVLTGMTLGNVIGTGTHRPLVVPSVAYLVGTWLVYYVGHGLFYRLGLHRSLRRLLGPEKAYTVYSSALGIVYFNVIWCMFPFLAAFRGTKLLDLSLTQVLIPGLCLFLGSFFIKLWATLYLGLEGYYYRDMFLEERRDGGPMTKGPYAVFSDPMYSVGYFPVYSGAIFALSLEGLVVAVAFHVSIYIFNAVVERPFVLSMYGDPMAAASTGVEADSGGPS